MVRLFKQIALLSVLLSSHVGAQEVTSGVTFRSSSLTGGEVYEFAWGEDDWRWGASWTTDQVLDETEAVLFCGEVVCQWQQQRRQVDAYWQAYVQRMFETTWGVYAGLGVSVHPEREPLLGLPASFRLTAGYRLDDRWSVEYVHQSNAGLGDWNWGQDVILIRYGWR